MAGTEERNPATTHIDTMTTSEMVRVMQAENENAAAAVGRVSAEIAAVIDAVSPRMKSGGHLYYVGCGTSGRIGVMDASECPPTYGVSRDKVVGIIAGGPEALVGAVEGFEDNREAGYAAVAEKKPTADDTVVGISAAGAAPFVLGALQAAREAGALTVGLTSNPGSPIAAFADMAISPETGPEVVTGSTRMKAGTAQKLILNMISTGVMIRQGHVYENMMINLKPSNAKLRRRCIRIVSSILHCGEAEAEERLERAQWDIRSAVGGE